MRVFVADDQAEVRSALRLLLEQEPNMTVVGEAAKAEYLLRDMPGVCPDLLLLDWELPDLQANDMARVRAACPRLLVVALSGRPEGRADALAAGADAFVSKVDPPECLLSVLHTLRNGHTGS